MSHEKRWGVFVKGFSDDTTTEDLLSHFKTIDGIMNAEILRRRRSNKAGNTYKCGVIYFSTLESCEKAIKVFDKSFLQGQQISCREDIISHHYAAPSATDSDQLITTPIHENFTFQAIEKTKVFVSKLAAETAPEDIMRLFGTIGPVVNVEIMKTKDGKPLGIAIVEFQDASCGSSAILQLHRHVLNGRSIGVREYYRQSISYLEAKRITAPSIPSSQNPTFSQLQSRISQSNMPASTTKSITQPPSRVTKLLSEESSRSASAPARGSTRPDSSSTLNEVIAVDPPSSRSSGRRKSEVKMSALLASTPSPLSPLPQGMDEVHATRAMRLPQGMDTSHGSRPASTPRQRRSTFTLTDSPTMTSRFSGTAVDGLIPDGSKVYVSHLKSRITAEDLRLVFASVGSVLAVELLLTTTGKSIGCAVVEYADDDCVDAAVEMFSGYNMCGRVIGVRRYYKEPINVGNGCAVSTEPSPLSLDSTRDRNIQTAQTAKLTQADSPNPMIATPLISAVAKSVKSRGGDSQCRRLLPSLPFTASAPPHSPLSPLTQPNKIFISNIPVHATLAGVTRLYETIGKITSAEIIRNKRSRKRNVVVEFASHVSCAVAVLKPLIMDGHELGVRLYFDEPPAESSAGSLIAKSNEALRLLLLGATQAPLSLVPSSLVDAGVDADADAVAAAVDVAARILAPVNLTAAAAAAVTAMTEVSAVVTDVAAANNEMAASAGVGGEKFEPIDDGSETKPSAIDKDSIKSHINDDTLSAVQTDKYDECIVEVPSEELKAIGTGAGSGAVKGELRRRRSSRPDTSWMKSVASEDGEIDPLASSDQRVCTATTTDKESGEEAEKDGEVGSCGRDAVETEHEEEEMEVEVVSLESLDISPTTFDPNDAAVRPTGWDRAKASRVRIQEAAARRAGAQNWEILQARAALEAEVEASMTAEAKVINRIRFFSHHKTAPTMPKTFHSAVSTHKAAALISSKEKEEMMARRPGRGARNSPQESLDAQSEVDDGTVSSAAVASSGWTPTTNDGLQTKSVIDWRKNIAGNSLGALHKRRTSDGATKLRYAQMEANGMVPLPLLDVDQVCTLLEAMELNQYVEAFRKARITGEQLQEFESAEDFEEEGIIMTKVKSKVFLKRIAEYREFGVETEIFEVDESGMVDEDTYDIDGNGPLSPASNRSEGEEVSLQEARIIHEEDFFGD